MAVCERSSFGGGGDGEDAGMDVCLEWTKTGNKSGC